MATSEVTPDRGETRRYLVQCEGCSFERTADGREEATEAGSEHRRETGHELVALEMPPSVTPS